MKKGLLIPAALLGAILAFCLWNGAAMSAHTARWRAQLEEADRLVLLEDGDRESLPWDLPHLWDLWPAAMEARELRLRFRRLRRRFR